MSLGGGQEVRRAVVDDQLDTGGTTEDQRQITAIEDREIVAVSFAKNAIEGFLEVSMSSGANIGSNDNQVDSRAGTVAIFGGEGQTVTDLDIEWSEGEEIHIHERNNTGATINYGLTIYYTEL